MSTRTLIDGYGMGKFQGQPGNIVAINDYEKPTGMLVDIEFEEEGLEVMWFMPSELLPLEVKSEKAPRLDPGL